MILEAILIDIRNGQERDFERDFDRASALIQQAPGYLSHELSRCLEKPGRYLFLARWETLEAHTEGFRKSALYPEWRKLLHHYYDPVPTVQHFSPFLAYPKSSPI